MFVDVLKKNQQTAYVATNSMSQQARQSKHEREKTEFVVPAYYDYRTQLITRNEFLKKVSSLCSSIDFIPFGLLSCVFVQFVHAFYTILSRVFIHY